MSPNARNAPTTNNEHTMEVKKLYFCYFLQKKFSIFFKKTFSPYKVLQLLQNSYSTKREFSLGCLCLNMNATVMQIKYTKNLNRERFELGTTLSQPIWSIKPVRTVYTEPSRFLNENIFLWQYIISPLTLFAKCIFLFLCSTSCLLRSIFIDILL